MPIIGEIDISFNFITFYLNVYLNVYFMQCIFN